jgi:histidinol phosphatase-like enzyme
MKMMISAVFLDRDGVINVKKEGGYVLVYTWCKRSYQDT